MNSGLSGNIIFDTGPLLEIAIGSDLGSMAKTILQSESVNAVTNELNLGELRYLICRKVGEEKSEEIIKDLSQSGFLRVFSFAEFAGPASLLKCKRALAFPDCFPLAMGEEMKVPVLFANQEAELIKEMKKEPFKTEIFFLTELSKMKAKQKP